MKKRPDYLAFGTPDFTEAEIDAVTRIMRSGWVGMGPETLAFESELAAYCGAAHVVSVNSCTSALFLALLAEGIGPGDEVVVPSLTWCATANAALYLGATPVLCDVDPLSMCVTAETVMAQITARTKAVVVVHYGGYAIDVHTLRAEIPPHVVIIEDAAHALGARYPDGQQVGASGNTVCFSFYANKNLSTADGGALALFDPVKAERLRCLRLSGLQSHAWSRFIQPSTALVPGVGELGFKMNFNDLQAAIGRVQLRRQPAMAQVRAQVAERYRSGLAGAGLDLPFQSRCFEGDHARHLLVVCLDPEMMGLTRDDLLLALRELNIGAAVHYKPLHHQPLYQPYAPAALPVTDWLANRILTLPIGARMSPEDTDYVTYHLVNLIQRKVAA